MTSLRRRKPPMGAVWSRLWSCSRCHPSTGGCSKQCGWALEDSPHAFMSRYDREWDGASGSGGECSMRPPGSSLARPKCGRAGPIRLRSGTTLGPPRRVHLGWPRPSPPWRVPCPAVRPGRHSSATWGSPNCCSGCWRTTMSLGVPTRRSASSRPANASCYRPGAVRAAVHCDQAPTGLGEPMRSVDFGSPNSTSGQPFSSRKSIASRVLPTLLTRLENHFASRRGPAARHRGSRRRGRA